MYLKLLEEAVLTEQGQPAPQRTECAADLSIAASIPDRYVPAPEQRMDLYRRIAAIRSEEDADDLVDELIDRYGEPPRTVNNLISVALLRAAAAKAEITDISQKNGQLVFTLGRFSLEQFSGLCGMEKYNHPRGRAPVHLPPPEGGGPPAPGPGPGGRLRGGWSGPLTAPSDFPGKCTKTQLGSKKFHCFFHSLGIIELRADKGVPWAPLYIILEVTE